jgi:tetratricopeptide (TPR) repeat protein
MALSTAQVAAVRSPPASDPTESIIADRYRVEARLGRGGVGAVFRVHDASTGRALALKRLLGGNNKRLSALFEFEYYTLSSLKHPNMVEAFDYGTDAAGPYYTMELLLGSDLSVCAPMAWQEACKIMVEAATGLGLLHARRLVHRDISPRNLWRTPDAQIKLIDFGALAPFGQPGDIVGTPPFVAPEALHGQPLDQRTDLYALGGLLYWLLTGVHAYPAKSLHDLHSFWLNPVIAASRRVANLERSELPPIPADLDALIDSLLSQDPRARPSNTGDVIDRVNAIAGLSSARRVSSSEHALHQAAYVGRERERRHFRRQLQLARGGRGGVTTLEGRRGEGRTRVLNELALDARLGGTTVLHVDAAACDGPHGVANAFAHKLLDALPEAAQSTAVPFAGTVAHLSAKLSARLGVTTPVAIPSVAGEGRARIQEALCQWFVEVSRRRPIAVLLDNLELADDGSIAWLLSLGVAVKECPILLVVAYLHDAQSSNQVAQRSLLQLGRRVQLRPLDGPETRELFASLFGDVPHLDRVSDRLQRAARGNPGHLIELAEHLVHEDVVVNTDGVWVLPDELLDEQIMFSRSDVLASRLGRLSAEVREVAARLSVRQGLIPIDMCLALAEQDARQLYPSLSTLVREGILVGAEEGYRFADEPTRALLLEELTEAQRKSAGARLGRLILSYDKLTLVERLEANVLLLEETPALETAGNITRLAQRIMLTEPDSLGLAAPLFERALANFRAAGRRDHELVTLLSALAVAGYFNDRKVMARYSDASQRAMSSVLKIPLMRRLRPWLGRKLSLIIGMLVAVIGFRRHKHNPCVPTLKETLMMFFNMMGSLSGACTITVDPKNGRKCAALLEPFSAMSKKSPARFIYAYSVNLAMSGEDRIGATYAVWSKLIAQLRDPSQCPGLTEQLRIRFLGGALFACGVLQCFRDDDAALRAADELETYQIKFYRMCADQLRSVYYANQGNLELFDQYRRRAELHAIQRGSSWQFEMWVPGASITAYLRTYDAMSMKHNLQQLQRFAKRVPSFALLSERAQGAYLLLRRKYEEALPWLERCLAERTLGVIGWTRAHGALARGLNGLGQHARAKEVCERALRQLTPEDLAFPAMNLFVQIELAIALAGLGQFDAAAAGIELLLDRYRASAGPLTLGALHEARARVALMAGDDEACRGHQQQMEARYRATGVSTLIARCETFAKEVRRGLMPSMHADVEGNSALESAFASITGSDVSVFERALAPLATIQDCAQRALALLADRIPQARAGIWVQGSEELELQASVGGELPGELGRWVTQRAAAATADDVTQTDLIEDIMAAGDPNQLTLDGWQYRVCVLPARSFTNELAGMVVLGSRDGAFQVPSHQVLEAVGRKLGAAMRSMHSSTVLPKEID